MYIKEVNGKGGISAKLVAYSIHQSGVPIATLELKYPRFIHSEFLTHRVFSRNSASSRAIPVERQIKEVEHSPATPIYWGADKAGMQANEEIEHLDWAKNWWSDAADKAVSTAKAGSAIKLHKQLVNRVLEPYSYMSTIVTSTEWENFFNLRLHPDAQPEFEELARCMVAAMDVATADIAFTSTHLPYVTREEKASLDEASQIIASVVRACRVSYGKQGGVEDVEKDVKLFNRLLESGHWSPFEHQAVAAKDKEIWSGNFNGWIQLRQLAQGVQPFRKELVGFEEACAEGLFSLLR